MTVVYIVFQFKYFKYVSAGFIDVLIFTNDFASCHH